MGTRPGEIGSPGYIASDDMDEEFELTEVTAISTGDGYDDTTEDDSGDEVTETRSRIEQTRAEMSGTIDAIQNKLDPGTIMQNATDAVHDATIGRVQDAVGGAGDTAMGFGQSIIETIKENPIPAALAGLGIGWLIVSGRKSSGNAPVSYRSYNSPGAYRGGNYSSGYPTGYGTGYGNTAGMDYGQSNSGSNQDQGPVGSAKDAVSSAAGSAQDMASNVAGNVQDAAGNLASTAANTGQNLAQTASSGVNTAQNFVQSNPLAAAAGALALGLAVGLAVPETPVENQFMGEARDSLMDTAQQVAGEKAQQVAQVAQQTASAAKDAAVNTAQKSAGEQGLTS